MSSKSKRPTDLDAGMEPERLPRDTDRDWPAATTEPSTFVHAVTPSGAAPAYKLLVELEARCAAGGSATLDDIRAVLKVLRGS